MSEGTRLGLHAGPEGRGLAGAAKDGVQPQTIRRTLHMSRLHTHSETHLIQRIGWLRAAVLGANDGIVSTASLIVGVASSAVSFHAVLMYASGEHRRARRQRSGSRGLRPARDLPIPGQQFGYAAHRVIGDAGE